MVSGAVANQATTDEASVTPFADVTVTEVDAGQTETVTVTPSGFANGTLLDPNAASDGSNITDGVYTVSGTAAQVTAALNGIVFTPTAHQVAPRQTITTVFSIAVTDTAGAATTDSKTSVVAKALRDAPTIAGTVAGQTTTDEAAVDPFGNVTIAEVDYGQTETVTITPGANANGVLSDPNAALDGSKVSGAGVYTVTGDAAAVTAALDGLMFTPTAHQAAPGQSVTTGFTIVVKDTAHARASDTTTTVTATAVEDAPTISGTMAGQSTTDATTLKPFATVTIGDADFGQTETVTITPSTTANGTLSDPHASTDGSTIVNGVYSITGTASYVTKYLDDLVFTPVDHEVAPGQSVTTGFTIADINTTGASTSDSTTSVVATANSDAPTITGATANHTTNDATSDIPFPHVTIAEVDADQLETVTVTPNVTANGVLVDPNAASDGGTVTNGVYSITGTAAAVTAALDSLVFTPTEHQVAPGLKVSTGFTIAAVDTAGASASNSTTIETVTASKDAPTITGAVAGQTTTDADAVEPFTNVAIGEVDFGQTETVTVKPNANANGVLSDPNMASDGSSVSSGIYTVTGDAASVTAAVDGLVFTPTLHQVAAGKNVTTTFTIGVTDTAGSTATNKTTTLVTTATHAVTGTTGNDNLVGTTGDDLINGEGGNDTATGNGGYDTYIFNAGYGTLAINNSSTGGTVPVGQLTLGLGLDQTDLWFIQSSNNLVIDVLGTNEAVTVDGWFGSNPSAQLAEIVGGNDARIDGEIGQLTAAMTTYQSNNLAFNPVTATTMPADPTLQSAITAAWHH